MSDYAKQEDMCHPDSTQQKMVICYIIQVDLINLMESKGTLQITLNELYRPRTIVTSLHTSLNTKLLAQIIQDVRRNLGRDWLSCPPRPSSCRVLTACKPVIGYLNAWMPSCACRCNSGVFSCVCLRAWRCGERTSLAAQAAVSLSPTNTPTKHDIIVYDIQLCFMFHTN